MNQNNVNNPGQDMVTSVVTKKRGRKPKQEENPKQEANPLDEGVAALTSSVKSAKTKRFRRLSTNE